MRHRIPVPHIGLRTIKTTAAIIISMMLVYFYGTTDSKFIFAMLGAMAAMEPTFKDSLEACLTQFVGVLIGALTGILLLLIPAHSVIQCAIGILLIITLYNTLHIRYSPTLPCMMVVIICTTPNIAPISVAACRFWDTFIGLAVGMLINTLIFPYDNSRQIRNTVQKLDQDILVFLEGFFDGDNILPDTAPIDHRITQLEQQLRIFSNQKLWLHLRRQHDELDRFRQCEATAKELAAQVRVLYHMDRPAKLNDENRRKLSAIGAQIKDRRKLEHATERDIVTNYHVKQVLLLRNQLQDQLPK